MLDTNDDAVISLWGEDWCMPSKDQALELYKNCKKEDIYAEGKHFQKFTGRNGNYIILPVYGYYDEDFNGNASSLTKKKEEAYYWTKDLCSSTGCGYALRIGYFGVLGLSRHSGANIRAVVSKKGVQKLSQENPSSFFKFEANDGYFNNNTFFPVNNGRDAELYKIMTSRYPSLKATKDMYLELLERDNPKTQHLFLLGYCTYIGLGTEVDKESSAEYLREGASKGDYRCTVMLFALGLANVKNSADIKLLSQAASSGYLPAKVILTFIQSSTQPSSDIYPAKFYHLNNLKSIVNYNYPEGFYLYGKIANDDYYIEKAADGNHSIAIIDIVNRLDKKGMYEKAFEYVKKGLEMGINFDKTVLTRVRVNGLAVSNIPQEVELALSEAYSMGQYAYVVSAYSEALKRNVVNENMTSYYVLAHKSLGVKDKEREAELLNLIKDCAEKGSVIGMEGLADLYEKGFGLQSPDMKNAFEWYRKAARAGSEKAKSYLNKRNLKW